MGGKQGGKVGGGPGGGGGGMSVPGHTGTQEAQCESGIRNPESGLVEPGEHVLPSGEGGLLVWYVAACTGCWVV